MERERAINERHECPQHLLVHFSPVLWTKGLNDFSPLLVHGLKWTKLLVHALENQTGPYSKSLKKTKRLDGHPWTFG